MPGRIIGQTVDLEGKRGFTMTFQTREQHIRREKATSNICTSQSLLALRSAIYLSLLGKTGLRRVAELCLQKAHYLASKLAAVPGCSVVNRGPWFREFTLQVPGDAAERVSRLVAKGFLAGVPLSRFDPAERAKLLIAVTEKRTKDEMDRFAAALAETR
jgi:glycine dehydrogenase subunit 1